MTKNEIVARFLDLKPSKGVMYDSRVFYHIPYYHDSLIACFDQFMFDKSYDWLMPVWVKFRDLQYTDGDGGMHEHYKSRIAYAIVNLTITEAFDELVKGIEWAESIKK